MQVPAVEVYAASPNGSFTCNNETVTYLVHSYTDGVTYEWAKPDGSTSDGPGLTATVPGVYMLTVTNPENGCQLIREVPIGASYPDLAISAGPDKVLTCEDKTVTLEGTVSGSNVVRWFSSDGEPLTYGSMSLVLLQFSL